jgi:hypothetical protein
MAPRSDATSGPPGGVPELDLRASTTPKARPKPEPEPERPLELAVDPRALVRERSAGPPASFVQSVAASGTPSALPQREDDPVQAPIAGVPDLQFYACLLADYGEPPRHWVLSPFYAWRVLKRRRELKKALAGRREEAVGAAAAAEEALVTFCERARATAEKTASYAQALEELRRAEELLRSRDQVLAAEQDAQNARLSQIDARLSNLEAELARAQGDERAIWAELSAAQGALGREEARLKRAEIELRAAQQRASSGEDGG